MGRNSGGSLVWSGLAPEIIIISMTFDFFFDFCDLAVPTLFVDRNFPLLGRVLVGVVLVWLGGGASYASFFPAGSEMRLGRDGTGRVMMSWVCNDRLRCGNIKGGRRSH